MTVRRWTFLVGRLFTDRGLRPDVGVVVTTLSPFAFDMFVKPRLFAWLESLVAWHHESSVAASCRASALTLVPSLTAGRGDPWGRTGAAWWAAVAYVVAGAAGASYLLLNPRLPLVTSGSHDFAIVPGALLPLLWLWVMDDLTAWPPLEPRGAG